MSTELFLSFTPGWLLDVTLQTTVLLALAGGVVGCARGMAAARRHFILASALMLIPVVMLCSFVAPVWRISWGAGPVALTAAEVEKKEVAEGRDPFAPRLAAAVTLKASAVDEESPSPLWALLWLGGVGAGAVALGGSALALRRLRKGSHMVVDATMQRCFAEEAGALQLELPAECLRMCAGCAVPMTWGISRKTVLLPEEAAEWTEARLRLVLRHELGHIARGDVLVTLFTTMSALMLWFHPLVWVVLRTSARAREQACDDVALARSGLSEEDFAEELLAAVAGLGLGGGGSREMRRGPWGALTLTLALAMAVSASARAMRLRLANLVQHGGRGRGGYSWMQKLMMLLPMLGAGFAVSGLSACRKAEPEVPRQILVRSRFVSIPKDSPVLAEAGLTLDGNNEGLQNLGLLDGEQTSQLLRKLSQQKGVALMSAPSVTTKSGARATVEVVREFIYPTEFDPPRLATGDQPLIPTTPTVFQMKPVGVRMDVVPTLGEDGNITLEATPEATSFEGFIDYGKPITYEGKVVSENKIQQPIFHTVKATASLVMKPGQSVVLGGLGSPDASGMAHPGRSFAAPVKHSESAGETALTSRMPETKDLVFFIIEVSVVDAAGKAAEMRPPEPAVSVFGQVKRQGRYVFKAGMTVKDLLDQAQGLNERADARAAEFRRGNVGVMIDLSKEGGKALEAEDTLTVLEK